MDLSVRDSAQLLKVSEKTIYRWVKQGKLPAYRINEQYRFNRAELLEWATSQRLNVSADIFAEPDGGGPVASLTDALKAGGIHYRLSGIDKLSVLQSLVEVMPLPEEVDRPFLLQVLLARESLGSTAPGQRHRGAARPQPDRHAHPAAHGYALLPRTGDRVRGAGRPAGPYAVHDCQPDDPRPPASAGATGLCVAATGLCRGDRPARGSREQILAASQAVDQSIPPPASHPVESLSLMVCFLRSVGDLIDRGPRLGGGRQESESWRRRSARPAVLLGGAAALLPSLRGAHFRPVRNRCGWRGRCRWLPPTWNSTPLSAVFAVAIVLVTMLAAVYGGEYLRGCAGRKNLGVSWFFFNLLAASMLLVVVARNGVLFLIAGNSCRSRRSSS